MRMFGTPSKRVPHFTSAALSLALLGSCSSAYVDAAGSDTATITFIPGGYVASIYRDPTECTDRSIVHANTKGADQSSVVKLPAGSEQAMTLAWGTGNPMAGFSSMCRNTFTFRPEKSKTYNISLLVGDTHCAVSVVAVADANGPLPQQVPVKLSPRETIVSMGEHGPWCEPAK
jgi:hypothetical protein